MKKRYFAPLKYAMFHEFMDEMLTATELAKRLHVRRESVSRACSHLKSAGFLEKVNGLYVITGEGVDYYYYLCRVDAAHQLLRGLEHERFS